MKLHILLGMMKFRIQIQAIVEVSQVKVTLMLLMTEMMNELEIYMKKYKFI